MLQTIPSDLSTLDGFCIPGVGAHRVRPTPYRPRRRGIYGL